MQAKKEKSGSSNHVQVIAPADKIIHLCKQCYKKEEKVYNLNKKKAEAASVY